MFFKSFLLELTRFWLWDQNFIGLLWAKESIISAAIPVRKYRRKTFWNTAVLAPTNSGLYGNFLLDEAEDIIEVLTLSSFYFERIPIKTANATMLAALLYRLNYLLVCGLALICWPLGLSTSGNNNVNNNSKI